MRNAFIAVLMVLGFAPLVSFAQTNSSSNANCVVLSHDMGVGATDATAGGDVTTLQNFLIGRGFMRLKTATTTLGTYGSQTANGVSAFQRNYGIIATGYVGPITRSNIQTLTCAIGAVSTTNLPSTISASSTTLLTFTSPVDGALVVKGEKDITPNWVVSSTVQNTFGAAGAIKLELIDSSGTSMGVIGRPTALTARNNNRVENNFVRTLATHGRHDNTLDPGQYRLRATLVYSGTDATLAAQALQYAAQSGWFTVVNPAPEPKITISASTTSIPFSIPVTITWSATASSTGCTFTDVAANNVTNVLPTGSQVVTPTAATSVYTVACSLTSQWPLPGMSYTTSAQRKVTVTIGTASSTPSGATSTPTITLTGPVDGTTIVLGNPIPMGWTYTNAPANSQVVYTVSLFNALGTGSKGGGVGQTLSPISGSGSGTQNWVTGDANSSYTNTPGTYNVSVTLNTCNTTGCEYTHGAQLAQSAISTVTLVASSTGTTTPASGVFTASPNTGAAPLGATFTIGGSYYTYGIGGGGYEIDFGDGSTAQFLSCTDSASCNTTHTINHAYGTAGTYTAAIRTVPPSTMYLVNSPHVVVSTQTITVTTGSTALVAPVFNASCALQSDGTYAITLTWNTVSGATNYPVRLSGPSYATNAVQYNGESVVGFNNPGYVDNPLPPTASPYTFVGLTKSGRYAYWGHAWSSAAGWSASYTKYVTCTRRSADAGSAMLAAAAAPQVLGASVECLNLGLNMHRGYEMPAVSMLQSFLASQGLYSGDQTGFYGDQTVAAVQAYQQHKGLPVTGMVYDATRAAIYADTCQ